MQNVSGSAAAWQEPLPLTDGRFTQIPRALHDLAKTPREYELIAALLGYRWFPSSPIIPSVATLAKTLRCSSRTVRRTAATLETRGLLKRQVRRAWDKRQMSNEYVLCGPLLALVADLEASRDQEARPSWQGRRTDVAEKRYSGNQSKRTTRSEQPDLRAPGRDFLETSEGWRYKPRT